jgi:hypothetical protein
MILLVNDKLFVESSNKDLPAQKAILYFIGKYLLFLHF